MKTLPLLGEQFHQKLHWDLVFQLSDGLVTTDRVWLAFFLPNRHQMEYE